MLEIYLCDISHNEFQQKHHRIEQMKTDCPRDENLKTRTHSQAPARKRASKGSWAGFKQPHIARIPGEIARVVRWVQWKTLDCHHALGGHNFCFLVIQIVIYNHCRIGCKN